MSSKRETSHYWPGEELSCKDGCKNNWTYFPGCESLLSPSLLTDSQRHLLIVLRILSQWSRQDVHNVTLGLTSDLDPASVMDDLLLLLGEQKGWDPHKPFCLQQVRRNIGLTNLQKILSSNKCSLHTNAAGTWRTQNGGLQLWQNYCGRAQNVSAWQGLLITNTRKVKL